MQIFRSALFCSVTQLLFNLMSLIVFIGTFSCTVTITFNAFVIELNDTLSQETYVAFLDMYLILGLVFAYYYLSERITADLFKIADIFYNSAWYRLKAKQQRLLVLPIQRAREEVRLTGLGIFECSLPVFATVRKFASSKCYEKWHVD